MSAVGDTVRSPPDRCFGAGINSLPLQDEAGALHSSSMEWTDEGIVLAVRPHGETAAILEVLTRGHGRAAGLVHGGRSRRLRPHLQIGGHLDVTWKARLADQLGHFTIDPRRSFSARVMDDPAALLGLSSIAAMARWLPERDPHPALFEITLFILGFLDDAASWPALLVRWELALLDELGFGLDLSACAVTGGNDALIYVSPRTGRAVSASAGEPYKDKLLRLPPFLRPRAAGAPRETPSSADVADGLTLTSWFINQRVLEPQSLELPEPRRRLFDALRSQSAGDAV